MTSTGQKGARSRLADVLADIKNSRNEDDCNQTRPTPAKRRSAVNYVALSGHTPRQSRSSSAASAPANSKANNSNNNNNNNSPNRTKTFVLRFIDNTVDLAQFLPPHKNATKEQSLYPIVRSWAQIQRHTGDNEIELEQTTNESRDIKPPTSVSHNQTPDEEQPDVLDNSRNDSSLDQSQQNSPRQIIKAPSKQSHTKKERADVNTICSNLLHAVQQH